MDGIESVLCGAPANQVYAHPSGGLLLFPRNYRLSDDISFRYSDATWNEWPLTAETFLRWIIETPLSGYTSLGMDYETLGEHQKRTGGILQFMENLSISKQAIIFIICRQKAAAMEKSINTSVHTTHPMKLS